MTSRSLKKRQITAREIRPTIRSRIGSGETLLSCLTNNLLGVGKTISKLALVGVMVSPLVGEAQSFQPPTTPASSQPLSSGPNANAFPEPLNTKGWQREAIHLMQNQQPSAQLTNSPSSMMARQAPVGMPQPQVTQSGQARQPMATPSVQQTYTRQAPATNVQPPQANRSVYMPPVHVPPTKTSGIYVQPKMRGDRQPFLAPSNPVGFPTPQAAARSAQGSVQQPAPGNVAGNRQLYVPQHYQPPVAAGHSAQPRMAMAPAAQNQAPPSPSFNQQVQQVQKFERRGTGLQDRIADLLTSNKYRNTNSKAEPQPRQPMTAKPQALARKEAPQPRRDNALTQMANERLAQQAPVQRANRIANPAGIAPVSHNQLDSVESQYATHPENLYQPVAEPEYIEITPAEPPRRASRMQASRLSSPGIAPRRQRQLPQRSQLAQQQSRPIERFASEVDSGELIETYNELPSEPEIQAATASEPVFSEPIQDPFGDYPPLRPASQIRAEMESTPARQVSVTDEQKPISILNQPIENYGAANQYNRRPSRNNGLRGSEMVQDFEPAPTRQANPNQATQPPVANQFDQLEEVVPAAPNELARPSDEGRQGDDEIEGLESELNELDEMDIANRDDEDDSPGDGPIERTCQEFRSRLLNDPITNISLDVSPPKSNLNNEALVSRTWMDRLGNVIATGTMTRLSRGYVVLDNGQKIAHARLGDDDLIAIAKYWQIPSECTIGNEAFVARSWIPQTFTWKASSLCHKPLYFENIQLERYGHSYGPFLQPVHSIGHFFSNVIFLPYHTALNPPNECQYALGFYRPGDCAPWLVDPVPFSLDGIKRQVEISTGVAFIP